MKKIMLLLICLICRAQAEPKLSCSRICKKDKQDLIEMFAEFIHGMEKSDLDIKEQLENRWWLLESPFTRIEKSLFQLNEMAQQIQNIILNSDDDQQKQCCHKLMHELKKIEEHLKFLCQELLKVSYVVGNLDDQSVGEQEFNSVADIDNAQLSLVSWAKTIYREQLKDKFIS